MQSKYLNIFLLVGIAAIVVMLCTFEMSYTDVLANLRTAGWWFIAVVLIWVPQYLLNAWSWLTIIRNHPVPSDLTYARVLKYTVSGYALNYVTPVGLLGGEPYRIMELTRYVGAARATSSVILYAMMHIFSHFIFWAFAIVLYLIRYFNQLDVLMTAFLAAVSAFCTLGIYFFMRGYRNGLAMKTLKLLAYIPGLRHRMTRFIEQKRETVERIDAQIAELHAQSKRTFYFSLFLEFFARVIGCFEILFIFKILTEVVSFSDCLFIQAFTSLFANLFFFMPMELGAREGGFALAVGGLSLSGAFGVLAGLLTRVRELIWIIVGIGLLKVGNNRNINA